MDRPKPRFASLPPHDGSAPEIRVYQAPPDEIGYLVSLVEAYEGIGLVRTLDRSRGIIETWSMPDARETFAGVLAAAARQFPIQPLERDFD